MAQLEQRVLPGSLSLPKTIHLPLWAAAAGRRAALLLIPFLVLSVPPISWVLPSGWPGTGKESALHCHSCHLTGQLSKGVRLAELPNVQWMDEHMDGQSAFDMYEPLEL